MKIDGKNHRLKGLHDTLTSRASWTLFCFWIVFLCLLAAIAFVAQLTTWSAASYSVARSGDLTLLSWPKSGGGLGGNDFVRLELLSADLDNRNPILRERGINIGSHSLSLDGQSVAVCTSHEKKTLLELYDVNSETALSQTELKNIETGWLKFSTPVFVRGIILSAENSQAVVFPTYKFGYSVGLEGGETELMQHYEPWFQPSKNRNHLVIRSFDSWVGKTGETETENRLTLYQFGSGEGLTRIPLPEEVEQDNRDESVLVGNEGAVYRQLKNELWCFHESEDQLLLVMRPEWGRVQDLDSAARHFAFATRQQIVVVDRLSEKVVGRHEFRGEFSPSTISFQDDEHLLWVEQPVSDDGYRDKSRNDELARWNWRSGQTVTRSLGRFDLTTIHWMRLVVLACVLAWLSTLLWFQSRDSGFVTPVVTLLAVAVFTATAFECYPADPDVYSATEHVVGTFMASALFSILHFVSIRWLLSGNCFVTLIWRCLLGVAVTAALGHVLFGSQEIIVIWVAFLHVPVVVIVHRVFKWERYRLTRVHRIDSDQIEPFDVLRGRSGKALSIKDLMMLTAAVAVSVAVVSLNESSLVSWDNLLAFFWLSASLFAASLSVAWLLLSPSWIWPRIAILFGVGLVVVFSGWILVTTRMDFMLPGYGMAFSIVLVTLCGLFCGIGCLSARQCGYRIRDQE